MTFQGKEEEGDKDDEEEDEEEDDAGAAQTVRCSDGGRESWPRGKLPTCSKDPLVLRFSGENQVFHEKHLT